MANGNLSSDSQRGQTRPEVVKELEELFKLLFPEPPPLDLITLDNVLERYPLTGLGALALAAIEQSQRIIRIQADNSLNGSSDFNTGLIYLYWGDRRAAANQFRLARENWAAVDDSPAICLSHFAQGRALSSGYHNEAAMMRFNHAERLLRRPLVGAQGERMAALAEKMEPKIKAAQETLRSALWPAERQTGPAEGATGPDADASASSGARGGQGSAAPEPPSAAEAAAGSPRSVFYRWPRSSESQSGVPLPISNLHRAGRLHGPVPGHISADERFDWYQIAEKRGEFLPAIGPGAWLLVDREFDEPLTRREYVVVGSRRNDLGSIRVEPMSHASVAIPHCYFGYREPDAREPSGARLYLDETRKPIPPDDVHVLAVVEGYWNGLNGHALPEP